MQIKANVNFFSGNKSIKKVYIVIEYVELEFDLMSPRDFRSQ